MNTTQPKQTKSHRSKRTDVGVAPNAITDHTLASDLKLIREFATKYTALSDSERAALEQYSSPGVALEQDATRALDFYYGMYVAAFQMYTMAYMSQNPMAPALMSLVHCYASRIMRVYQPA